MTTLLGTLVVVNFVNVLSLKGVVGEEDDTYACSGTNCLTSRRADENEFPTKNHKLI